MFRQRPPAGGVIDALLGRLSECRLRERAPLRRTLLGLRRRAGAGEPLEAELARVAERVTASAASVAARRARIPAVSFPPELPISACVPAIAEAIAGHPVTVVCGDTGSGKTTQLPKVCLAAGRGITGVIGHTQPRRLAARSVAVRIGAELGPAGALLVGHKVRFSDRTHPETAVKLMTDGILLAEIPADRELLAYDTLILDEAHERSLNIDFLLGYLRRLLPRRPDLKVVITSATIDPVRFARHFAGAPVIEVPGRTYPVEVRYRPLAAADEDERDQGLQRAVLEAVDELAAEGPGDVLVFLPGEREIRETGEALRKHHPAGAEVLPLYARLSAGEQQRVFQPASRRRVVLATNVAETSLTVPGVRYVVDTGLARISRYSHRTKVQRLPVEPISGASADQRKGRCGRLGPGVCIRLYAEEDLAERPRFTEPEILRTNLAAVILRMEALGLGAVERFPFVDPPDRRYVSDGYRLLGELGAVDRERHLTGLGRELARLPLDPRLGRMVLAAREEGCLAEVLIIVSALSVQDPRERPSEHRAAAEAAHREHQDPRSDFLSLLRLWSFYHGEARHLSQSKLRKLCREHFLSYFRMREWHDVHQQVLGLLHDMGVRPNEEPAEPERVHRAVLAGLIGHIGLRREDGAYRGPRGLVFHLGSGSALAARGPRWVMAAELVETRRVYARTVAPIDPRWVEALAGDLARRHHSEPHWDERRAEVMVFEEVTLWGMPLITHRRVPCLRVDPVAAREVFLREALVGGRLAPDTPFLRHNLGLLAELAALEHKARRRGVMVDEETVHRFYEERVPEGIASERALAAWRREAERAEPRVLYLTREALASEEARAVTPERFPDVLWVGETRLPLTYRYEPGHEADGVTVRVPLLLLASLPDEPFEWLVPGLLAEKLAALIRGLPRLLRRNFVPVPDFARDCVEALPGAVGDLLDALGGELRRRTRVEVPRASWHLDRVPEHLRMRFEVVDATGWVLAASRDLGGLRRRLARECREAVEAGGWPGLPEGPRRRWDLGDLPGRVEAVQGGVAVTGYPALRDRGDAVVVAVLPTRGEADRVHRAGVRRLFALDLAPQLAQVERSLPRLDTLCLAYSTLPDAPSATAEAEPRRPPCKELREDLVAAAIDRCFLPEGTVPRTEAQYRERREAGRADLAGTLAEVHARVGEVLHLHRETRARLAGRVPPGCEEGFADVGRQVDRLVYRGFVVETPARWLGELPRYLRAALERLGRMGREPQRDARDQGEVARLWDEWLALSGQGRARRSGLPVEAEELRWVIEELRVSLFGRGLKTLLPVSVPRLQRQLADLRAALGR
jgi:ATP-dependent helicase HrpA